MVMVFSTQPFLVFTTIEHIILPRLQGESIGESGFETGTQRQP